MPLRLGTSERRLSLLVIHRPAPYQPPNLAHEALMPHPLAGRLIGFQRGDHHGSQVSRWIQHPKV